MSYSQSFTEQIMSLSRYVDHVQNFDGINNGVRIQIEQAELRRRMILDYLADRESAPVSYIADSVGLTTEAVRKHLAKLLADGIVEMLSTFPREWRLK